MDGYQRIGQPPDENQADEVVDDQEEVDDSEGSASDNTLEDIETSEDEHEGAVERPDTDESDHSDAGMGSGGKANDGSHSAGGSSGSSGNSANGSSRGTSGSGNRKPGERTFVSYVAMHPRDDEGEDDPDGLDHGQRLALEAKAITLIQSREPLLKSTPAGNQGFDLVEADVNGEPERWVEVKAMKGSLEERSVGLSSAQFEFARQHGEQFWLYVVERADDHDRARIVKIKDPVGKAGSFTFDKGWGSIAEINEPSKGKIQREDAQPLAIQP